MTFLCNQLFQIGEFNYPLEQQFELVLNLKTTNNKNNNNNNNNLF